MIGTVSGPLPLNRSMILNGGQYPDAREFFDSDSTVIETTEYRGQKVNNIRESVTTPKLENLVVLLNKT